jgi:hypothetical protein
MKHHYSKQISSKQSFSFCVVLLVLYSFLPSVTNVYASWDVSAEYSWTSNPNGVWSYGRKWDMEGSGFDLMSIRWGSTGWLVGYPNYYWHPSVQAGPLLWANDNSNGFPVVRWTSPESGLYDLTCTFTGADSRGNDNQVYVTINGDVEFTSHIQAYQGTATYSLDSFYLAQGSTIDLSTKWNGATTAAYNWIGITGTIESVPEPATLFLLSLGGLAIMRKRG